MHHRPAVPVALILIAGILLGDRLPGYPLVAFAGLMLAVIRLLICLRHARSAWLSPLVVVLAAGYLSMVPWRTPNYGANHLARYLDGYYWQVHATAVEPSQIRLGRTRTVVAVKTLGRGQSQQPVSGRLRLTIMGETTLLPGDRIRFAARLRPFRNFRNPGSFDYAGHMAARRIHGSAWVRLERLECQGVSHEQMVRRMLFALRQRLGDLIDSCGGVHDPDARTVLKALVFGDRSEIDPGLRERFNRAGVGHVLAISGLHVGIVAVVAFWAFRWMFNRVSALLWRGWGRTWAAGATLVPVATYAVLAGLSPSTQRAGIMVAVFLVSIMVGRSREIVNTLAVAALIILAVFPPALFSVAFQLSFASVLAIVYGISKTVPPEDGTRSWPTRVGRRLVVFVWVSVLAIAGTMPLTLYHFNQTSMVGILANLVVVPLAGFVAVPLGLTSALLALVGRGPSMAVFSMALFPLDLTLGLVNGLSGLSFAAVKTVTPSMFEMVLYYLAAWCLLNLRQRRFVVWVLAAVLVAAVADGLYWGHQRFWHRDLRVAAIDVGQGGATLIELPGGKVVLMDGGGFADNRRFDVGERIVAPFLWRRKIGRVDILVLSHPNADHLNGLIYIARHFGVGELWTNGDVNTTVGYGALMDVCRQAGVTVRRVHAASAPAQFGDASLSILHPPPGFFDASAKRGIEIDQDLRNGGSLVLKASFGDTAFLITGDITTPAERLMVRHQATRLDTTVLFAPHHGSRTSSSPELIRATRPAVVVISAGAGNRFGFPHDEVTARYRATGATILCTCTHGAVFLRTDGHDVTWDTVAGSSTALHVWFDTAAPRR